MEMPNFWGIVLDRIPWQTIHARITVYYGCLSSGFLLVATKLATSTNSNEPLQMACKKCVKVPGSKSLQIFLKICLNSWYMPFFVFLDVLYRAFPFQLAKPLKRFGKVANSTVTCMPLAPSCPRKLDLTAWGTSLGQGRGWHRCRTYEILAKLHGRCQISLRHRIVNWSRVWSEDWNVERYWNGSQIIPKSFSREIFSHHDWQVESPKAQDQELFSENFGSPWSCMVVSCCHSGIPGAVPIPSRSST